MASDHGDDVPLLTDVCPRPPRPPRVFPARKIQALSIALVVFGGCAMVFNGVGFTYNRTHLSSSQGFYGGAAFIATGIIGIIAAKKKNKCMIITTMIMSLVSAVAFSTCLFAMSVFDLVADVNCYEYEYWYGCNLRWVAVAMGGMLIICSILSFAMSLRIAVLCCQYYFDCCARGDCSCCDLEENASCTYVPMYGQTTTASMLSPPYVCSQSSDNGAGAAAGNQWQQPHQQQKHVKQDNSSSSGNTDAMKYLSQLSPAQLQLLVQLSQMSPLSPAACNTSSIPPVSTASTDAATSP